MCVVRTISKNLEMPSEFSEKGRIRGTEILGALLRDPQSFESVRDAGADEHFVEQLLL